MPSRQKRQQAKSSTVSAPTTPENPQRLIIGVDFGTTFTSVAYVRTRATRWSEIHSLRSFKDDVISVRRWPDTSDQNQLPTTLLYDKSNPTKPYFGYGVDYALDFCRLQDPSPVLRLFKLLLHRSKETQKIRANLEQTVGEFDKNPIELIEDFLARLRAYLFDGPESFFRMTYGSRPDKEGWKIEWALGIPAAWQNPQEQQMYVDAARRAGIASPALISEPEATASVFFAENDEPLEIGDIFIVCDAGGGTVDVITYRVSRPEPLQVVEASVGEGELCGSIYLNENFRKLLQSKLATEEYLSDRLESILDYATEKFDHPVKTNFGPGGDNEEEVFMKLPGHRGGGISLTLGELRHEVFDPVFSRVHKLIEAQIQSSQAAADREAIGRGEKAVPLKVKNIILAGGMSGNAYFYHYLSSRFNGNLPGRENIEVRRPPSSVNTSVARGAALMAVDRGGLIKQRKSQYSYGVKTWVEYDYKLHGHKKKAQPIKDIHENYLKVDVVDWIINKNEPITQEILHADQERYRTLADGESFVFTDEIIISSSDSWGKLSTLITGNETFEDSVINRLLITTDLSLVSKDSFERVQKPNSDKYYWKIVYKIGLVLKDNQMTFFALTKTPDGWGHRTECKCDFDSVESDFASLGTVGSRWRDQRILPRTKFGQVSTRILKRPRNSDDEVVDTVRKSPRTHKQRVPLVWDRRRSGVARDLFNSERGNAEQPRNHGDHLEGLRELSLDETLRRRESTEEDKVSIGEEWGAYYEKFESVTVMGDMDFYSAD